MLDVLDNKTKDLVRTGFLKKKYFKIVESVISSKRSWTFTSAIPIDCLEDLSMREHVHSLVQRVRPHHALLIDSAIGATSCKLRWVL